MTPAPFNRMTTRTALYLGSALLALSAVSSAQSSTGEQDASFLRRAAAHCGTDPFGASRLTDPVRCSFEPTADDGFEEPLPLLDLVQFQGQFLMPDRLCGYELQVFGAPGTLFTVQVMQEGQASPQTVGEGFLDATGRAYIALLPLLCEDPGGYSRAELISFATAPVRVDFTFF